jgi:ribosome-binding factor A
MKSSSRRPEQVAETIRQVITDALARGEVRDPRVGSVTVTAVRVTNDLSHAQTMWSGNARSRGCKAPHDICAGAPPGP